MADMARDGTPELLYSRIAGGGFTSARTLERDSEAGRLRRIHRGVYAGVVSWEAASDRHRALARTAAVVGTRRDRVVLSHESAALIWGLPRLGPWPKIVELADVRGTLPRSRHGVCWRRTEFDRSELVEIRGFTVTSLEQTLIDIARTRPFLSAVVALDAAIGSTVRNDDWVHARGVDKAALLAHLDADGPRRGSRFARNAIEFADHSSESVGESLSRGQIHLLGFPAPTLQVEFDRADGGADRVDFDWPDYGVFGEFDGDAKYLDPRYRRGRTIEQVILDEKKRADRICLRHRRRHARWDWPIARAPIRLANVLLEAGLPQRRPSQRREGQIPS